MKPPKPPSAGKVLFSLARYAIFGILLVAVGPVFIYLGVKGGVIEGIKGDDIRGIAVGLCALLFGVYFLYMARERWREYQAKP